MAEIVGSLWLVCGLSLNQFDWQALFSQTSHVVLKKEKNLEGQDGKRFKGVQSIFETALDIECLSQALLLRTANVTLAPFN